MASRASLPSSVVTVGNLLASGASPPSRVNGLIFLYYVTDTAHIITLCVFLILHAHFPLATSIYIYIYIYICDSTYHVICEFQLCAY